MFCPVDLRHSESHIEIGDFTCGLPYCSTLPWACRLVTSQTGDTKLSDQFKNSFRTRVYFSINTSLASAGLETLPLRCQHSKHQQVSTGEILTYGIMVLN